jgi:ATP-dependent Clp protease adaptor protein ClpS
MPEKPSRAPSERGDTLTRTRSGAKLQAPGMWKVVLHNDDFTTQEFVVWLLRTVFHKPDSEAVRIMLSVHREGRGTAGLYTRDVAETKVAQAKHLAEAQEFPLLCTAEPE